MRSRAVARRPATYRSSTVPGRYPRSTLDDEENSLEHPEVRCRAEPGLGTVFTGHGALLDEADQTVGHSYGTCTGTRLTADGLVLVCDVAHELDDGDIHLSLVTRFDLTMLMFTEADTAVVGGTGRYQDVTGRSHLTPLDRPTQTYQWDHELHNVPPRQ